MQQPPDTPLEVDLARELAARAGAKAVVAVRVNPVGSGYVLSARLLSPDEPDSAVVYYRRFLDQGLASRMFLDDPLYPFTLQHLAKLYDDLGDREHAIEYYRRFTELWKDADPELQPRVEVARRRIQELMQRG